MVDRRELVYDVGYIYNPSKTTNETIQKASKLSATNGFMLQDNHQARKITLIQIENSWAATEKQ